MPNRILKESIRESDSIDSLNWFQEVLFYRLIVSCDDYGRFDGRISVIKNRLFPLKEDLTLKTVADAIQKLVSVGLVVLYEHDGKPYLYLPTWTAHQNVRAKRSKYPEPESACNSLHTSASKCMQVDAQENIGNHLQENVPVIQSVSESLSVSISESNTAGDDGDNARASDKEMAFIGLKKNELVITRSRVKKTIEDTTALFRKYRPGNTPSALDHRMVFFCADKDGNTELLDYAFEQAQLAEKVNDWRYICGIIRSLRDRKITTVEQARQWDDLRPDQKGTEAEAVANNILENHRRQEAGK